MLAEQVVERDAQVGRRRAALDVMCIDSDIFGSDDASAPVTSTLAMQSAATAALIGREKRIWWCSLSSVVSGD